MEIISYEDLKKAYNDLSDGYDILQEKLSEALKESQDAHDRYCDLVKLIINENPIFLKKALSRLPGLSVGLFFKLNDYERKVLFQAIKVGKEG